VRANEFEAAVEKGIREGARAHLYLDSPTALVAYGLLKAEGGDASPTNVLKRARAIGLSEVTKSPDAIFNKTDWSPAMEAFFKFATVTIAAELLATGLVALAARGAATVELPAALQGGSASVDVYLGVRGGNAVYAGITNDIVRRQGQHGARFVLQKITGAQVARGEARAIEEALIVRNPHFENIRHSISPRHPYYQQAVNWGESWLKSHGY